jgi:acyl-CoA-binding protein
LYKEKKFEEAVREIDSFSIASSNSKLIPKFALLKALSIGKYESRDLYKKALEFVAIGYANKEEGVKAKEILAQLKK